MILTDIHTHSTFSADGRSDLADMVASAEQKGLRYYGISEHFDFDYRELNIRVHGKTVPQIDAPAYFSAARALQTKTQSDTFRLLVGGEFGFAENGRCASAYAEIAEKYRPDFIVNSVHTCDGVDCYFCEYFEGREKMPAYRRYLELVRKSLDAPYPYDIVAHIGYVSRNAPYPDPKINYADFPDLYDDILKTVVNKGKILEVNSSARTAGSEFLPDCDVLSRYYELGGRKISFASDAHDTVRIAEKRDLVVGALKKIGFTEITVPDCGKEIKVPI